MSICLLPDPSQCNHDDWLAQLRDLLCTLECTSDEIQCVPCDTAQEDYYTAWDGCYESNAEIPCGSIILEQCPSPTMWIWDGTNWNFFGTDNEFRVVPNGTAATPVVLNAFFAAGVPNTSALVYIEGTGFYYTDDAGATWNAVVTVVNTTKAVTNTATNAQGTVGYPTGSIIQLYPSSGTTVVLGGGISAGDLIMVSFTLGYRITRYANVSGPVDNVHLLVDLSGRVTDTIEFKELRNGWESHITKYFIAGAAGSVQFRFRGNFLGNGPATGAGTFQWQWYIRQINVARIS